jgi:hypothetical protein
MISLCISRNFERCYGLDPRMKAVELIHEQTYTILKLAFCRRQRALGSRYQRPSG